MNRALFHFAGGALLLMAAVADAQSPASLPTSMTPVGVGYGAAVPPIAPNSVDNPGFNSALSQAMPLTPDQITAAKHLQHEVNQAIATPADGAPHPQIATITIPLNPGSAPPVIHLAEGNITTLIFEDQTGAPWPVTGAITAKNSGITAAIIGNDLLSDVSSQAGAISNAGKAVPGETTEASDNAAGVDAADLVKNSSNIVALIPSTPDIVGKNLVVTLEGYNLPMMFTFDAGSSEVDYRTNVRVPANGPNAIISTPKPDMPSINANGMQAFVDGVPPSGAQELDISDPSISAWMYDGKMFVRTSDAMASPSLYHRGSPTGDVVYVLQPIPVFSVFYNGALEQVTVSNLPPAYEYQTNGQGPTPASMTAADPQTGYGEDGDNSGADSQ